MQLNQSVNFILLLEVVLVSNIQGQQVYFETSPSTMCVTKFIVYSPPTCASNSCLVGVLFSCARNYFSRSFHFRGFSSDLPRERRWPYDARCCPSHIEL